MLRTPTYREDDIRLGNIVAIRMGTSEWLSPGLVAKVTEYYYEAIHNGRLKTSGINQTCLMISASNLPSDTKAKPHEALLLAPIDSTSDDGTPPAAPVRQRLISADQIPPLTTCDLHRRRNAIDRSEVQRVLQDTEAFLQAPLGPRHSQIANGQTSRAVRSTANETEDLENSPTSEDSPLPPTSNFDRSRGEQSLANNNTTVSKTSSSK